MFSVALAYVLVAFAWVQGLDYLCNQYVAECEDYCAASIPVGIELLACPKSTCETRVYNTNISMPRPPLVSEVRILGAKTSELLAPYLSTYLSSIIAAPCNTNTGQSVIAQVNAQVFASVPTLYSLSPLQGFNIPQGLTYYLSTDDVLPSDEELVSRFLDTSFLFAAGSIEFSSVSGFFRNNHHRCYVDKAKIAEGFFQNGPLGFPYLPLLTTPDTKEYSPVVSQPALYALTDSHYNTTTCPPQRLFELGGTTYMTHLTTLCGFSSECYRSQPGFYSFCPCINAHLSTGSETLTMDCDYLNVGDFAMKCLIVGNNIFCHNVKHNAVTMFQTYGQAAVSDFRLHKSPGACPVAGLSGPNYYLRRVSDSHIEYVGQLLNGTSGFVSRKTVTVNVTQYHHASVELPAGCVDLSGSITEITLPYACCILGDKAVIYGNLNNLEVFVANGSGLVTISAQVPPPPSPPSPSRRSVSTIDDRIEASFYQSLSGLLASTRFAVSDLSSFTQALSKQTQKLTQRSVEADVQIEELKSITSYLLLLSSLSQGATVSEAKAEVYFKQGSNTYHCSPYSTPMSLSSYHLISSQGFDRYFSMVPIDADWNMGQWKYVYGIKGRAEDSFISKSNKELKKYQKTIASRFSQTQTQMQHEQDTLMNETQNAAIAIAEADARADNISQIAQNNRNSVSVLSGLINGIATDVDEVAHVAQGALKDAVDLADTVEKTIDPGKGGFSFAIYIIAAIILIALIWVVVSHRQSLPVWPHTA